MKLNATAMANAAAATAAILWIVCSLLVVMLPGMMLSMTGHMVYLDMGAHSWVMSAYGFGFGLIIWVVLAWVIGWLVATFYNRFDSKA